MPQYDWVMTNGIQIHENAWLVDRVQARTHRRSRINKKWRKRYEFKNIPTAKVWNIGGLLYTHPDTIKRIDATLRAKGVDV